MRALTVRQPWAWAIVHGGKDVENRNLAFSHRGPLAVHAGLTVDDEGMGDARIGRALRERGHVRSGPRPPWSGEIGDFVGAPIHLGAVIGVVELVGAHLAVDCWDSSTATCCSPWADAPGRAVKHLELADPRPLSNPVPCRGRQGLWRLDRKTRKAVEEAIRV